MALEGLPERTPFAFTSRSRDAKLLQTAKSCENTNGREERGATLIEIFRFVDPSRCVKPSGKVYELQSLPLYLCEISKFCILNATSTSPRLEYANSCPEGRCKLLSQSDCSRKPANRFVVTLGHFINWNNILEPHQTGGRGAQTA